MQTSISQRIPALIPNLLLWALLFVSEIKFQFQFICFAIYIYYILYKIK